MKPRTKFIIIALIFALLCYALLMAIAKAAQDRFDAQAAHINEWACPKIEAGHWYQYQPTGDYVIAQGPPVAGHVAVRLANGGAAADVECRRLWKFDAPRQVAGYGS